MSVEEKKLKAAEKLERKLRLTQMSHMERERVWLEEMSEGVGGGGGTEGGMEGREEEEEEDVCEGGLSLGKRPIRAEERKTRKQRRREMLRRKEVS